MDEKPLWLVFAGDTGVETTGSVSLRFANEDETAARAYYAVLRKRHSWATLTVVEPTQHRRRLIRDVEMSTDEMSGI